MIPEGGLSTLDAPDQAFYDPAANAALFDELEQQIQQTGDRKIIRLPYHINESEFAQALVAEFEALCPTTGH